MKLHFNPRLTSGLATLLVGFIAWVSMACLIPQPSHACCAGSTQSKLHQKMPCCVETSAVQLSSHAPQWTAWPNFVDALPPAGATLDFSGGLLPNQQSVLASSWIKDQSGRYLELRVLLN
jgi:hypothetical protein